MLIADLSLDDKIDRPELMFTLPVAKSTAGDRRAVQPVSAKDELELYNAAWMLLSANRQLPESAHVTYNFDRT